MIVFAHTNFQICGCQTALTSVSPVDYNDWDNESTSLYR